MELTQQGKVAPVTDAGRWIGASSRSILPGRICIFALSPRLGEFKEIADDLMKTANIDVQVMPADLCDPAALQRAIAQAVEHFVASTCWRTMRADFFTLPKEDWQGSPEFHNYVRITHPVWPPLHKSRQSIVNAERAMREHGLSRADALIYLTSWHSTTRVGKRGSFSPSFFGKGRFHSKLHHRHR